MRVPVPLLVTLALPISAAGLAQPSSEADPPGVTCARSGPEAEVRADTGQRNRPPAVTIEEVSTTVGPDGTVVTLRANATDPDDDELSYIFFATSGSIAGRGPEVQWRFPGPGFHLVTLQVSDDHGCARSAIFTKDLQP